MKKIIDMNKFKELFYVKKLACMDIANILGITVHGIDSFRFRHKLPKRGWASPPMLGKKHKPETINKMKQARKKYSNAQSILMTGKKRADCRAWKGGKIITTAGYQYEYIGNEKYRPEHRLVMEKHLSKKLFRNEVVHHINENKLDNRIENLMILSNSEHMKLHHPKGKPVHIK